MSNYLLDEHIDYESKLCLVPSKGIQDPLTSALDFFEKKLGTRDVKVIKAHYKKNPALGIDISFLQDLKDFS